MAVVQGIKEKVHLPIYDCIKIDGGQQLRDVEKTSTLKLFVDVQGKTKLETNLQSASLLPHYNTFEARAMRVVVSDLRPEFSDKVTIDIGELDVRDRTAPDPDARVEGVEATVTLDIQHAMDLLADARDNDRGETVIDATDNDAVELRNTGTVTQTDNWEVPLTVADIEAALREDDDGPSWEQIISQDGVGLVLCKFIYNTVTTLYVGEKVMIEMPTWFFPGGAGPFSDSGHFSTHGEPNPTATFRFAEPIFIDRQQNFRVEIEIPNTDTFKSLQKTYGPLFIWVVLDGYMTRGVQ